MAESQQPRAYLYMHHTESHQNIISATTRVYVCKPYHKIYRDNQEQNHTIHLH